MQGRAVFASGSPFAEWKNPKTGRVFYPGQGNNAYIFPGVALGIIRGKIRHVTNRYFLEAAKVKHRDNMKSHCKKRTCRRSHRW